MQILDRRTFLALTGGTAALGLSGGRVFAQGAEAQVFTADPFGALVDSTVILGAEKAVLIDAQMNVANATALADMIAATGRALETIFITHHHPDHILGLDILLSRFPEAKAVTHAAIRPVIEQSAQPTLDFLTANNPPGSFAGRVVIPEALAADHILLEGERIEVLEPMHGDTALVSAVHIPTLDTLIASDFAYADTHAWVAENQTPDLIGKWRESLGKLEALGAGTVIPGHRLEGSANDATIFAKTRAYLDQWETARASAKSADELRAAMMTGNEALGLTFALDMAVSAAFPG
jgi:glyoxylase-like metal-dependent hydrolase (beta-lactamase superfamily II)